MIDVSLLIVTRPFWPIGLQKCLQSIKDHTNDLSNIEVMLKIDHDCNPETLNIANEFKNILPLKIFILDGVKGRNDLPNYCNVLAWNSTGKLLWFWSDETRILTDDWNILLKPYANKFYEIPWAFYPILNGKRYVYNPLVTRAFTNYTGRFTYHQSLDSYIDLVTGVLREYLLKSQNFPLELRESKIKEMEEVFILIDDDFYNPQEFQPKLNSSIEYLFTNDLLNGLELIEMNDKRFTGKDGFIDKMRQELLKIIKEKEFTI